MPSKAERPKVPKFQTEAEEAKWWFEHRDMAETQIRKAIQDGTVHRGGPKRVLEDVRLASKVIAIRVPAADIERARTLAAEKGLAYQTYMKMLLHQALNDEERDSKRRRGA